MNIANYSITTPPDIKGILVMGNVQLHLTVYPNAFHRFMQRLVFGFVWKKAE